VPGCPAGERGGSSGTLPDPAGQGVLRLASDDFGRRGFVIFGTPFATTNGLVITFDLFAYGVHGGLNPQTGGDGIALILVDGAFSPTQPGAPAGALSYSQLAADPGVTGGYLGIGFDEYGGFATEDL
jgi:hypothetical protein